MKKIITLICALAGFASMSSAASVDDLVPLKHSYVLVGDDYTNNGTEKIAKGALFGDDHFYTPTGHDKATNKGSVDLSVVDELGIVTEEIVNKYAEYGKHLNSLRLKAAQDVFAMRVTAGSKVIIFFEKNKETDNRYPIVAEDAKMENKLTSADNVIIKGAYGGKQVGRFEWTADDDRLVYVGAENQIFLSYVIIEANEAPGTPAVKVGPQAFENGLWFKEVTCTPREAYGVTTDVYYTTDGSTPSSASEKYTAPIKCYKEMTVKFQAYVMGMAVPDAENEANVNFSFDAPEIAADGATFTITTPYAEQNGTNYYTLNGGEEVKGDGATLTESATVSAYTKIVNGDYATFTSKKSSKDVYVLNPIKEKKTIQVIAGDVVLDEEATATSTTGEVYTVENGEISADKMDFFVKDLTFKALKDEQYQVPAGNERYIQMSNTNITFQVAEGDSVTVKVICSKNSCKNIDAEDAEDGSQVNDRKCYVNVSGTNYAHMEMMEVTYKDQAGNDSIVVELAEAADLKLFEDANIIEFGLTGGTYTFQKYSGTGNILISSIEIAPAVEEPVLADFEDGKYYLVNVASEKAWGCGNNWGTQASLVNHPAYVVLHKQENGTYFMETQASNGGESYYFGGEYMDGSPVALTILKGEEMGEDMDGNPVYVYYVTADGTNFYGWDGTESTILARNLPAGDEKAMWVIASHEQALKGLTEATEEDPMDATFLILDPDFDRNNRNASAWVGDGFGVPGGNEKYYNAEKWGGNSQTFSISQTAEVPNGKYKISWYGFYRYNNTTDNTNQIAIDTHADGTEVINSFVSVNGKDYALTSIADEAASAALDGKIPFSQQEAGAAFAQGLYQQSDFVVVTDGKLTIGVKKIEHPGCDWTVWDNFELEYYGPASEEPAEPGKLIAEKDWTTETGYPYYNMGVPEGASYDVEDGALVVTNTVKQANIWDLQLFALDWFNVTQGHDYVVRFYATIPVDGQVQVNMGTWNGADQHVYDVTASQTTKAYDFAFDNYQGVTTTGNDAHVLWQQGWLVGTVKISKVQVFEKEGSGIESMVAEKLFNGAIYNLAGQKVDANYKGVVIKNGKKMLQK